LIRRHRGAMPETTSPPPPPPANRKDMIINILTMIIALAWLVSFFVARDSAQERCEGHPQGAA
jgi:hypothetical protein